MAHGTRINGTSYGVTGGRCMVNGTAYSIKKGRTMVNGTVKEILFTGKKYQLNITGIYGWMTIDVKIDGQSISMDGTYDIYEGSVIYLYMEKYRAVTGRQGIYLDGISVGDEAVMDITYSLIVKGSYDIVYIDEYDMIFDITTK